MYELQQYDLKLIIFVQIGMISDTFVHKFEYIFQLIKTFTFLSTE